MNTSSTVNIHYTSHNLQEIISYYTLLVANAEYKNISISCMCDTCGWTYFCVHVHVYTPEVNVSYVF